MMKVLFNSGIGVDIDSRKVSIAYMKGSFQGAQLTAEESLQLGEGKPFAEHMVEIAAFINGFIKKHQIPDTSLFIGIPGQYCVLREVEFPLAVKENLRSTLTYEMEKYIPLAVDDIYFDCQVVSEDKAQQRLKVMIAVIKKEHIQPYLQLAALLEKGASGIEAEPAAVTNYFLDQYGAMDDPLMIVCLKENGFELIHLHNHALIYARSVEVAGPASGWGSLIGSHLTQVGNMFSTNGRTLKLWVCGHPAAADIGREICENPQFEMAALKFDANGLSAAESISATGLALRGVRNLPVQMNFMPENLRKKPDKTGLWIMMALAILFIISGITWAGNQVMSHRALMAKMDQEIEKLKTEAAEVEKINEEVQTCQARIDYLSFLRPGNVYLGDIGKDLSERIPVSAWIKELKMSGNQLTLYGSADSASDLVPLLEASPIFSDVKFLSTIRKDRDDKEIFRIGLTIVAPVLDTGGNQ
jgi:Tfp pilus assembly protein PilN